MLNDKYRLRSSINQDRRGTNQNIRTFLIFFNKFYDGLRSKTKPNFSHEMRDPYGFALMCSDYKKDSLKYDMDLTCKEIFEEKATEDRNDLITYQGQFSFVEILDMLYIGFLFDYQKAIDVYNNQRNAFDIFNQIINGNGFVYNRARPELKKTRENIKFAFESAINLNENLPINTPHIWRLCDGMVPPFIVMKHNRDIRLERLECHGFGEGLFIVSGNKIIDCLKINDTWFTDLPLEHRLFFAFKCTECDVAEYAKAQSLRSILEVGKLLGGNKTNGLLVRGARENFFHNRWFNWSKTSLIYCKKINGQLTSKAPGRAKPAFYTLEGDEGIINPFEERKYERVFLDDWDINEFKKILELK